MSGPRTEVRYLSEASTPTLTMPLTQWRSLRRIPRRGLRLMGHFRRLADLRAQLFDVLDDPASAGAPLLLLRCTEPIIPPVRAEAHPGLVLRGGLRMRGERACEAGADAVAAGEQTCSCSAAVGSAAGAAARAAARAACSASASPTAAAAAAALAAAIAASSAASRLPSAAAA